MAATSTLSSFCFIMALLVIASSSSSSSAVVVGSSVEISSNLDWLPIRSGCRGTVAECMAAAGEEDEEFELDSEINRRILANNRYVSYGALQKNNVPCSRRGASYYNCQKSGQANPYSRGCSTISRCSR